MENECPKKYSKPGWNTAEKKFYPHLKPIRDELKEEMTNAENILWQCLRNKKLGVKFRRQHIIACYIPDFVALSIKLIVEVDGKIHLGRKKEDAQRAQNLQMLGYEIIRFKNEEIEEKIEEVLNSIRKKIEKLEKN